VVAAPTTYLRESLARVKAVLDVTILGTQPRHRGLPVEMDL
jgi:vancomycin permeability regulator SanA